METNDNIYIGIDVSKEELVVAYLNAGRWVKSKINNTLDDIHSWLLVLGVSGKHFILEATGPYSERLIFGLFQLGADFSVVNPLQSRAMSRVLLKSNKNDDQDAQTLSLLGEKLDPKVYNMPSISQKRRKEAFSALCSLQKQEQQLKNQLHAFEYRVEPNPIAVKALQDVLVSVQQSIVALEKEIKPEQNEEEDRRIVEQISSIKSVGKATAETFVTLFGNFSAFEDGKALAKFIGVTPSEFRSGKTVHRRSSITKRGNSKARAMLFNCARSAIQHNPKCKELYERLVAKDKNGKVALTAVMHKLARTIYGVVISGKMYDPNYTKHKQIVA